MRRRFGSAITSKRERSSAAATTRTLRSSYIAGKGFIRAAFGFLARLGATRGGSPGIFGYTGGQGASVMPLAMSRS